MNKQEIEKALDGLKRMRIAMFNYCIDGERLKPFLDTTISALEKQLTNGWIPASERLPKEDGNYLVTMKHKEFNQTRVTSMDFNDEFLFNDYFEKAWWEVTAWRPLPEPWKGDNR